MAITFPTEGRVNAWAFLGGPTGSYLEIHLYQNTITWDDTITLAGLVEANFSGYAPIGGVTWSAPVTITGGDVQITSPVVVFTHGPASDTGVVQGYYVTMDDGNGAVLLGGEAFATMVYMDTPTSTLPLQIAMSLRGLLA